MWTRNRNHRHSIDSKRNKQTKRTRNVELRIFRPIQSITLGSLRPECGEFREQILLDVRSITSRVGIGKVRPLYRLYCYFPSMFHTVGIARQP